MRPLSTLALVMIVLVAAASPARAERPTASPKQRFYGWQPLICDAGALGLGLLAATTATKGQSKVLGAMAAVTYVGCPAAMHAANGRTGRSIASPLLRVGLPLGLLYLETYEEDGSSDTGEEIGAVIGGIVLAVVVDDLFLSWKPVGQAVTVLPAPVAGGGLTLSLATSF